MNDLKSAATADNTAVETKPEVKDEAPRHINSVDATTGQPIVDRVMARKAELEALLGGLPADDLATKGDIQLALSTINDLLTGDLEKVPPVVAVDMSRWLETNKHLGERVEPRASSVPVTA